VDLFNTASEKLNGKIDHRHSFVDFSQLEVTLPKQGGGSDVVKTCPAAMGFAFAAGTTDGPGAFDFKQGDNEVTCDCNIYALYHLFCHDIQWLPISLDCCLLSCYIREMPSGDLCATS